MDDQRSQREIKLNENELVEAQMIKNELDMEQVVMNGQLPFDIRCPICHGVLFQPVSCGSCLNHFCNTCLQQWLQKNKLCPLCKKQLKLQRCFPILQQFISQLQIRCSNLQNGCSEIMGYDQYQKHSHQCDFRMIMCTSAGCPRKILKRDLALHLEQECQDILINCQHCNQPYRKKLINQHEGSCDFKIVECELCEQSFSKKEFQVHKNQCPESDRNCKWCQKTIKFKLIPQHEEECEMRIIECDGCEKQIILGEFMEHHSQCPLVHVICKSCQQNMHRYEYQNHDKEACIIHLRKYFEAKVSELEKQNEEMKKYLDTVQREAHQGEKIWKFNQVFKDQDIFLVENQAVALVREHKKKRRDRFVIVELDKPLSKYEEICWKYSVIGLASEWFAVGITDESNIYTVKRYNDIGHLSYLVSANGIVYNSHDAEKNHSESNFIIRQTDKILCRYHLANQTLTVLNETQKRQIVIGINRQVIEQSSIYPCVCLRSPGDKVKIEKITEAEFEQTLANMGEIRNDQAPVNEEQNNQNDYGSEDEDENNQENVNPNNNPQNPGNHQENNQQVEGQMHYLININLI